MPRLSAWAVRAALVHFMLGFTFGGLILASKGTPLPPALWRLLPAHIEFLLLGWMAQLALGVAFWILPRFPGGSRGDERLAWAAIGLLNLGLVLAGLSAFAAALLVPARLCEAGAGALFALHAWPRIRPLVPGA